MYVILYMPLTQTMGTTVHFNKFYSIRVVITVFIT